MNRFYAPEAPATDMISSATLERLAAQAAGLAGLPIRSGIPSVAIRNGPQSLEEILMYMTGPGIIAASYEQDTNIVKVPPDFDINSAKDRGTFLHELVHFTQFGPNGGWGPYSDRPPEGMRIEFAKGKIEGQAYLAQMKWSWQWGMTPLVTHGLGPAEGFQRFQKHMPEEKALNKGPWLEEWTRQWHYLQPKPMNERVAWLNVQYEAATARMLSAEGRY